MFLPLITTTLFLIVFYAAAWHDESAREPVIERRRPQPRQSSQTSDNQNVNP